jgi:hypothetical protein
MELAKIARYRSNFNNLEIASPRRLAGDSLPFVIGMAVPLFGLFSQSSSDGIFIKARLA